MDALESLEKTIETLLTRYASLQQENRLLQEENERQRSEILRTHSELVTLQAEYKHLRLAQGLGGESPEQRETAKRHLAAIIAQVERAIDILKQ